MEGGAGLTEWELEFKTIWLVSRGEWNHSLNVDNNEACLFWPEYGCDWGIWCGGEAAAATDGREFEVMHEDNAKRGRTELELELNNMTLSIRGEWKHSAFYWYS